MTFLVPATTCRRLDLPRHRRQTRDDPLADLVHKGISWATAPLVLVVDDDPVTANFDYLCSYQPGSVAETINTVNYTFPYIKCSWRALCGGLDR